MAEVEAKTDGAIPRVDAGEAQVRPRRVLLQWVTSALALYIAAMIVRASGSRASSGRSSPRR